MKEQNIRVSTGNCYSPPSVDRILGLYICEYYRG